MRILILGLLLVGSFANAKTEIVRTASAVYYKTPMNEMLPDERQMIVGRSIEIVKQAITNGLQERGLINPQTADYLRALEVANQNVDNVAAAAMEYANSSPTWGISGWSLVPSALIIHFGGKLALNIGGGASGSLAVGVVLMPVRIQRLDLVTRSVTTYHQIEYALIGFGSGNLGAGAGGGGAVRAGIGFVWGPLESPEDFKGLAIGASGDATLGPVGMNIKGAILKQWGNALFLNQRVNPFVLVSWQGGVAAEAAIHGNVTPVVNLTGPLRKMMEEALGADLGGAFKVEDQRMEAKLRRDLLRKHRSH